MLYLQLNLEGSWHFLSLVLPSSCGFSDNLPLANLELKSASDMSSRDVSQRQTSSLPSLISIYEQVFLEETKSSLAKHRKKKSKKQKKQLPLCTENTGKCMCVGGYRKLFYPVKNYLKEVSGEPLIVCLVQNSQP